jgi:hypothetical protein
METDRVREGLGRGRRERMLLSSFGGKFEAGREVERGVKEESNQRRKRLRAGGKKIMKTKIKQGEIQCK